MINTGHTPIHHPSKPVSGSKSAGGTKGKADSSKSSAAKRAGQQGPRDRVLLSPCRGVVQPKIKGALKRRRYHTKFRLSAPKFEQLTKVLDQQFPFVAAMHGDWLDSGTQPHEDAVDPSRTPQTSTPAAQEATVEMVFSSASSSPIYLLEGL